MGKKLGIIAGEGSLPRTLSENAQREGSSVYALGMNLKAFLDLQGKYTEGKLINVCKVQEYINFFQKHEVQDIVFVGKVHKLWALAQIPFLDEIGRNCLKRMMNLQDNTIHQTIHQFSKEQGFNIISQRKFLQNLLAKEGNFTKRKLTDSEQKDIEYGFDMAQKASKLGVSQLVVVKNCSVMAFEAAEGSDKTIERGCKLAHKGAIIIKVPWADQSEKFDLPTIGPRTIKIISKNKGSVLAIKADSTFIAETEITITLANKLNIALLAI